MTTKFTSVIGAFSENTSENAALRATEPFLRNFNAAITTIFGQKQAGAYRVRHRRALGYVVFRFKPTTFLPSHNRLAIRRQIMIIYAILRLMARVIQAQAWQMWTAGQPF
jgi:hypothetical protein